jgi:hypothetical protein
MVSVTRTISRKAYSVSRKTRSGKIVNYKVKASRVKDVGAPGKWTVVNKSRGIGKLKKGELKKYGYEVTAPVASRRASIERAVRASSPVTVLRRLNAVATYTKRTSPIKSRTFAADKAYVQRKYFGK